MIISHDKNKKLRAKFNGKSYVVKRVNDKYIMKIDDKPKNITSVVKKFLSTPKSGGGICDLPPELIGEISQNMPLKDFLIFIAAQKKFYNAVDNIIGSEEMIEFTEKLKFLKNETESALNKLMTDAGQGGIENYDTLNRELHHEYNTLIGNVCKK